MWYDLFIAAILVFAAFRGAQRGAIFQVAAIASVVLCFVFAEAISAAVGPAVPLKAPLNNWVVMVAAYLVFSFASFGFARVLERWVEKAGMREFNRHVGGALGLVKGAVLALVITFFAVTLSPKSRALLADSRSGHLAADVIRGIHPVMPENLQRALDNYRLKFEAGFPGDQLGPNGMRPVLTGEPGGVSQTPAAEQPAWGFDDLIPRPEQPTQPNGSQPSDPFGWPQQPQTPQVSQTQPPANDGLGGWGSWIPQPTQPQQPTYPNQQPTGQQPGGYSVDAVLDRLPVVLSGDLDAIVREGLTNRTPQELAQMEQQLRNANVSDYRSIATQWLANRASQYLSGQTGSGPTGGGWGNPPRANPSDPNRPATGYPGNQNGTNSGYGVDPFEQARDSYDRMQPPNSWTPPTGLTPGNWNQPPANQSGRSYQSPPNQGQTPYRQPADRSTGQMIGDAVSGWAADQIGQRLAPNRQTDAVPATNASSPGQVPPGQGFGRQLQDTFGRRLGDQIDRRLQPQQAPQAAPPQTQPASPYRQSSYRQPGYDQPGYGGSGYGGSGFDSSYAAPRSLPVQPVSRAVPQPPAQIPRQAPASPQVPGLADLQRQLAGTPRSIADAVIADYVADMSGAARDPDPTTTARTSHGQRYEAARRLIAARLGHRY